MTLVYKILLCLARFFLFFAHPVFHVRGKENLPAGRVVICCNHSGLADPLWLLFGLWLPQMPVIMAKKEAMEAPVLGPFLRAVKVIGVDRGHSDVNAIKAALKALRADEKMILFPEGTRVKPGKTVTPKTGAAMLAARTDTPLLPVYLTRERRPFSPMTMVIGKPFYVQTEGAKATAPELQAATDRLMREIYAMERTK